MIQITEYNAFTDRPFAGNPAGVVTDASGLDEPTMLRIARQLNLSETAFLSDPEASDADIRLRWFTPTEEVKLCGHATIAAFTAAVDSGVFQVPDGEERVLGVETLSGVLRVRLSRRDGRPRVAFQIPVPRFEALDLDREEFARLWGITAGDLGSGPILRNQIDYWFIPVRDLAALRRLQLDVPALSAAGRESEFAFHTTETVDPESDWHLRFFAPFCGVPEDPVTGSAQGPMGVIHRERVGDDGDGWHGYRGEQGDHMDRPGRVEVRVLRDQGAVADLEIEGTAIRMLEGEITI